MNRNLTVEIKDIGKSYRGVKILKDCSYVFEKGRMHALIGPNGSGKSTLLRICGLIEIPDKGQITYYENNHAVEHTIELRRRISMVFSKDGLFNTTVFKNASYGLKVRGTGFRARHGRVKEILKTVGLWEKRKQSAKTLSAGEGQRLAIARSLVIDPEIIFLDEPTASLDPANTALIENIIKKLIRDTHKTVIMATHNMFQAQRLSDRIIFMHEGELYDEGLTDDFFERPKNEIAYQFLSGKLIY
ncbi:MAG: phosphate ABC transporter ATP-binding protein [Nitrospiraceae bacterium]|nr:MAG: phosphate ABC transporter ATP-binding protein [Nitrospiraceae bacterium]